jgi:hypothetical protein
VARQSFAFRLPDGVGKRLFTNDSDGRRRTLPHDICHALPELIAAGDSEATASTTATYVGEGSVRVAGPAHCRQHPRSRICNGPFEMGAMRGRSQKNEMRSFRSRADETGISGRGRQRRQLTPFSHAVTVTGFVDRLMGIRRRRFHAAFPGFRRFGMADAIRRRLRVGRMRWLLFRYRVHLSLPEKQKGHHPLWVMASG